MRARFAKLSERALGMIEYRMQSTRLSYAVVLTACFSCSHGDSEGPPDLGASTERAQLILGRFPAMNVPRYFVQQPLDFALAFVLSRQMGTPDVSVTIESETSTTIELTAIEPRPEDTYFGGHSYAATSEISERLAYEGGSYYRLSVGWPDISYSVNLLSPSPLEDEAVQLTPVGEAHSALDGVMVYEAPTSIRLRWRQGSGECGYAAVFKADPTNPNAPVLTYESADIGSVVGPNEIECEAGEIVVPRETFNPGATYAVVLVALKAENGDYARDGNYPVYWRMFVGSGVVRYIAFEE